MEQHQDPRSIQADHHLLRETYPRSMGPMKNGYHKQTRYIDATYRVR